MKTNEQIPTLRYEPSVARRAQVRPMARLMLAVAILSASALSMKLFAQTVTPIAPTPGIRVRSTFVDLVPQPKPGATDTSPLNFCYGDTPGRLTVGVHNLGNATAGASQVKVVFVLRGLNKTVTQPVPSLAPGATGNLLFDYPAGCSNPDCNFSITVDSQNQVPEKLETNNQANGRCLG